jgi:hypothetical protein
MKDLDAILAAAKPGDKIQLEAAWYSTAGRAPRGQGPFLPHGCQLIGVPGRTVIQLRQPDNWTTDLMVLSTEEADNGGCMIQGITTDCGPAVPGFKCNGISMIGSNNTAVGCNSVNAWGAYADKKEAFGIAIFSGPSGADVNGNISGCFVTNPQGDYVTAIKIGSGSVDGNMVVGKFWTGIGVVNGLSTTFTSNYISGATNGFYTDTGINSDILIYNNTFFDVVRGVCIRCQSSKGGVPMGVDGLNIDTNSIFLRNSGPYVAAVELDNSPQGGATGADNVGYAQRVTFQNNMVFMAPPGKPTTFNPHCRYAANIAATDPNPSVKLSGITRVLLSNNTFQTPVPGDGWTFRNMGGKASLVKVVREVDPGWVTT